MEPLYIGITITALIIIVVLLLISREKGKQLRKRGLVLTGTIFTLFYLPPLGIPAITLLALSKNEFE